MLTIDDLPNAYAYPTDNTWGIPALPLTACADHIPLPILAWGSYARDNWHPGTTHFYVDDYRFARLRITPPSPVIVEPNYSTDPRAPAVTLYTIWRKRRIAWLYAQQGTRIIADLNIPLNHLHHACTGLPAGWHAYAWRCHRHDPPTDWDARYTAAQRHAGERPLLLLIIGGGKRARLWAADHAAIWIESKLTPWDDKAWDDQAKENEAAADASS